MSVFKKINAAKIALWACSVFSTPALMAAGEDVLERNLGIIEGVSSIDPDIGCQIEIVEKAGGFDLKLEYTNNKLGEIETITTESRKLNWHPELDYLMGSTGGLFPKRKFYLVYNQDGVLERFGVGTASAESLSQCHLPAYEARLGFVERTLANNIGVFQGLDSDKKCTLEISVGSVKLDYYDKLRRKDSTIELPVTDFYTNSTKSELRGRYDVVWKIWDYWRMDIEVGDESKLTRITLEEHNTLFRTHISPLTCRLQKP